MDTEKIAAAVAETVTEKFADFEKAFMPVVEKTSLETARKVAEQMVMDKFVRGYDRTGLSNDQKKDFAAQVISAYRQDREGALRIWETKDGRSLFGHTTKANEALIEEQDNRGGYLVQNEVADAIMRIAASVGTIMKQAQKWPMKTDELGIPNYTGAFLTGSYVGVDLPGPITGLAFGQAVLIARKWQLAFTVGNDLLSDATVQLGEWLLALAGEALANMIDQQGFVGSSGQTLNSTTVSGPFTGILNAPGTQTYYFGNSSTSGKTSVSDFDVVTDPSQMVGLLEESILDGAAFYMHRTTWAAVRVQKDSNGMPVLPFGGLPASPLITVDPLGGPIKPAGELIGFPVYTNRWLPQYTTTASADTAYVIFGNLKACAFGDKGDMRIAQFQSGNFGTSGQSKEIALSDQTGIVYKHRHAFQVVLPQAFVIGKTSKS